MKKFIMHILVFSLPIILAGYFLDRFISNRLSRSTTHAKMEFPTWNAILNKSLPSGVWVYGSSRAWVHFDTHILEDSLQLPAFNLGMDGHTFNLLYLRHVLALKNNQAPKLVILSVDIGTLNTGNLFNDDQFLPYMLWNRDFYRFMSKYQGFSWYDYNVPLLRFYGRWAALKTALKMTLFPSKNLPGRYKGYKGQDERWNGDFDRAKATMQKYVARPDSTALAMFDSCLNDFHKRKVPVAIVYSPYYIEGQQFIENQQEVIERYRSLSKKYECTFFDYTRDSICFDKQYFYNASHMNRTGAEKFTRQLCADLKKAGLVQASK